MALSGNVPTMLLNATASLTRGGNTTKLGEFNTPASWDVNNISAVTCMDGDTVNIGFEFNGGIFATSSCAEKFPEGDIDNPWTIHLEDDGLSWDYTKTLSYNVTLVQSIPTAGNDYEVYLQSTNCYLVADVYTASGLVKTNQQLSPGTKVAIGNYYDSMIAVVITAASGVTPPDPPTPSKTMSFTWGINPRPGVAEAILTLYNKAGNKFLYTSSFDSEECNVGASRPVNDVPNEDNGQFTIGQDYGSGQHLEIFNLVDGQTFLF